MVIPVLGVIGSAAFFFQTPSPILDLTIGTDIGRGQRLAVLRGTKLVVHGKSVDKSDDGHEVTSELTLRVDGKLNPVAHGRNLELGLNICLGYFHAPCRHCGVLGIADEMSPDFQGDARTENSLSCIFGRLPSTRAIGPKIRFDS